MFREVAVSSYFIVHLENNNSSRSTDSLKRGNILSREGFW